MVDRRRMVRIEIQLQIAHDRHQPAPELIGIGVKHLRKSVPAVPLEQPKPDAESIRERAWRAVSAGHHLFGGGVWRAMTFADTAGLYAILDRSDESHETAKRRWLRLTDSGIGARGSTAPPPEPIIPPSKRAPHCSRCCSRRCSQLQLKAGLDTICDGGPCSCLSQKFRENTDLAKCPPNRIAVPIATFFSASRRRSESTRTGCGTRWKPRASAFGGKRIFNVDRSGMVRSILPWHALAASSSFGPIDR